MIKAWQNYWFKVEDARSLALIRVIIIGYCLFQLSPAYLNSLINLSEAPIVFYRPFPLYRLFSFVMGGIVQPTEIQLRVLFYLSIFSGFMALIGLWSRLFLPLFFLILLFFDGFTISFDAPHHKTAILAFALAILSVSYCSKVYSLDSFLNQRNRIKKEKAPNSNLYCDQANMITRWPLLLMQWLLGMCYLSAAVYKLAGNGLDWMNGSTLQFYLLAIGTTVENHGLATWLATQPLLCSFLSWLLVFFEATFIFCINIPKLRLFYLPAGLILHAAFFVFFRMDFTSFLLLYPAFVPLNVFCSKVQMGPTR